ncbi:MAG: transporter permease [Clostridia bacterium]|jgi:ABC-type dipeptide/oligopeptide/nickel transport system permease subunit|nr:transporter permease [Clostridia bacterium]
MNTKKVAQTESGTHAVEKPESQLKQMWYALIENKAAVAGMIIILFLIFLAVFAKFIAPYDPNYADLSINKQPPSMAHWFGTDEQGRDILSRVIDGTKVSLSVGVVAVIFALTIGTVLGAVAGYKGGKTDMIIMRFMDIMMSIPDILLAITFMAALGRGIDKAVIAIGLVTVPEYARIVRGSILSIKESEYVQAAKVIGNNDVRIVFKHILPNVLSPIIVRATLGISTAVLNTAALGFLGLGVQPPAAEWGDMLGRARVFIFEAPYMLIFPGIAITITVLAFNLLGDGLRDAFDPKSRK